MTEWDAGTVAVGWLHPGHVSTCFQQSLMKLYFADVAGPRRIVPRGKEIIRLCSSGDGVAEGRNLIVKKFLDGTDCDWLFMVDSDMGFPADTVERLIADADVDRPVIGALCFALAWLDQVAETGAQKFAVVPTVYQASVSDSESGFQPIRDYPRDALVRVDGTGAACMVVHRTALETVRAKFGTWFAPLTHPTGLHGKPRRFSEDLSFCVRLAMCDIPLHVDTSVKTCHDKGGVFLDEDEFDRRLAVDEAADGREAVSA